MTIMVCQSNVSHKNNFAYEERYTRHFAIIEKVERKKYKFLRSTKLLLRSNIMRCNETEQKGTWKNNNKNCPFSAMNKRGIRGISLILGCR